LCCLRACAICDSYQQTLILHAVVASTYKMVKGLGVLEDLASLRHLVFLLLMCGLSCAVPLHSGGPSVVLSPDVRGPQAVKSSVVALPAADDHVEGRGMRNAVKCCTVLPFQDR
jgi:hypothetical protein